MKAKALFTAILSCAVLSVASCSVKETDQKSPPLKSEAVDYSVGVKFMNDYKNLCDKMMLDHSDLQPDVASWITNNKLLSANFINRYHFIMDSAERADPGYGLGFDPIFDAQDYTDGVFEIKEIDSAANLVTVIGKEDRFECIVKVIRANNKSVVEGAGIINIPKNRQRNI